MKAICLHFFFLTKESSFGNTFWCVVFFSLFSFGEVEVVGDVEIEGTLIEGTFIDGTVKEGLFILDVEIIRRLLLRGKWYRYQCIRQQRNGPGIGYSSLQAVSVTINESIKWALVAPPVPAVNPI